MYVTSVTTVPTIPPCFTSAAKNFMHHARYLQAIAHAPVPALEPRPCVVGNLSQRYMVIKKQENETPMEQRERRIRNRIVYNDRGNWM
jgi:hypothetical protein